MTKIDSDREKQQKILASFQENLGKEIEKGQLELLLSSVDHSEQFLFFERNWIRVRAQEQVSHPVREFFEKVENSHHSLRAWLLAYECFEKWLEANRKKVSYRDLLDYLSCCSMISLPSSEESLKESVSDMLSIYGLERGEAL